MSHRFSAFRAAWAGSTVLAVAAFGLAAPAAAQDGEAASDTDGQLATIIVTANRREENLQDVPVSAAILELSALQHLLPRRMARPHRTLMGNSPPSS